MKNDQIQTSEKLMQNMINQATERSLPSPDHSPFRPFNQLARIFHYGKLPGRSGPHRSASHPWQDHCNCT
jgi:hypothetical protein